MEKKMILDNTIFLMEIFTMENGGMILNKDKENMNILCKVRSMRVIGYK